MVTAQDTRVMSERRDTGGGFRFGPTGALEPLRAGTALWALTLRLRLRAHPSP